MNFETAKWFQKASFKTYETAHYASDYVSNLNICNTEDRDVHAWRRLSLIYVSYNEKQVMYGASGRIYYQQWPAYGISSVLSMYWHQNVETFRVLLVAFCTAVVTDTSSANQLLKKR